MPERQGQRCTRPYGRDNADSNVCSTSPPDRAVNPDLEKTVTFSQRWQLTHPPPLPPRQTRGCHTPWACSGERFQLLGLQATMAASAHHGHAATTTTTYWHRELRNRKIHQQRPAFQSAPQELAHTFTPPTLSGQEDPAQLPVREVWHGVSGEGGWWQPAPIACPSSCSGCCWAPALHPGDAEPRRSPRGLLAREASPPLLHSKPVAALVRRSQQPPPCPNILFWWLSESYSTLYSLGKT